MNSIFNFRQFSKLYNEKLGDVENAHKAMAKKYEAEKEELDREDQIKRWESERLGTNIGQYSLC